MPQITQVGRVMVPVADQDAAIAFYRDKLGFQVKHKEPDEEPFFAIVGRDGALLFLKAGEATPLPNSRRDPATRASPRHNRRPKWLRPGRLPDNARHYKSVKN